MGEQQGFAQLVFVDNSFDVFSRLWCIAELVQAFMSRMPQQICVHSNAELDVDTGDLSTYLYLGTLSVAECKATRPEDKAEILGKIPDLEQFETSLQEALFSDR